jgi:hypothetical protein
MVKNLTEMGFPEDRAKLVLKHFKNNLDLSMDYLINTPPESDSLLIRQNNPGMSQSQSS